MTKATNIEFGPDAFTLTLESGSTYTAPYSWYPRLANATPEQRLNYKWIGQGIGIHWPDIDEDLEVQGVVEGRKSVELGKGRMG